MCEKIVFSFIILCFIITVAGCGGGPTVPSTDVILPSPVVSASDGVYTNKVSIMWNSISGANYYRVYRSDSLNGIKTALGNWQSSTLYDDYDVISGKIYYYWVICALYGDGTGATSDFGGRDTGYAGNFV